jgi:hypothetical protein
VKSILEEFSAVCPGNVFVTDNASNMKTAFREFTWLGCACHNLNLVLAHGLSRKSASTSSDETDDSGVPAEVVQLIDSCKEIATPAKRTHLNATLETTLKQCAVTRWNSTLTTLKSFAANLEHLRSLNPSIALGVNRNLLRLLVDINETLLNELVEVLEPFDTATKCLSTDSSPTIHLVVPTKVQLSKHLSPSPSDCAIIAQLKQQPHSQLECYFKVAPLHFVATLLDYRLKKNLNTIPPEQHNAAITSLKHMVSAVTARGIHPPLRQWSKPSPL